MHKYSDFPASFIRTILEDLASVLNIFSSFGQNRLNYTANKGPVRIQYKCPVPIYVFSELKLLFSKQN